MLAERRPGTRPLLLHIALLPLPGYASPLWGGSCPRKLGRNPGDLVRELYDGHGEEVVVVGCGAYVRSGFVRGLAIVLVVHGLEPDRVGTGGQALDDCVLIDERLVGASLVGEAI